MMCSLTWDSVRWVWSPVIWLIPFFIAVLHLQCHRVSSGQLGGQVSAALCIPSQPGNNLPHSVLTSP